MTRRRRWILAVIVLIPTVGFGALQMYRQARIDRLSAECAAVARNKDWPRLEVVAREWLSLQSAPVAWYWLGASLKERQQFEDAEQAFAKVPRDGLRGIDAATARLEIQYHVRQHPLEAVQLADELLLTDPRLASPRRHLIHFYAMTFQRPKLIRETRLAIKHRVDLPEHYVYLMSVEDLSFRDAAEVTGLWSKASPDSVELRLVHQMHRLRSLRALSRNSPARGLEKQYRQIRSEFAASIERQTTSPLLLDTLLLMAIDDSDVDEVGRLLALVPDEAADDPVFWKYRGWYATRSGDHQQAADSYEQSLKLHPLAWQARNEYADLLRLGGRTEDAGKVQSLAAQGARLMEEIRRLKHVRDVPQALLTELARYAGDAGDRQVSQGIVRRQRLPNR